MSKAQYAAIISPHEKKYREILNALIYNDKNPTPKEDILFCIALIIGVFFKSSNINRSDNSMGIYYFINLNLADKGIEPDSKFMDDLLLAMLFDDTYHSEAVLEQRSNGGNCETIFPQDHNYIPINFIVFVMEKFIRHYPEFDFASLKDKQGNSLGDLLLTELSEKLHTYSQTEYLQTEETILDFINRLVKVAKVYGTNLNNPTIGGINILRIVIKEAINDIKRCEPQKELEKFDSIFGLIKCLSAEFDFNQYGEQIINLLKEYTDRKIAAFTPTNEQPEYELIQHHLQERLQEVITYIKIYSNPHSKDNDFREKLFKLYRLESIRNRCNLFQFGEHSKPVYTDYENVQPENIDFLLQQILQPENDNPQYPHPALSHLYSTFNSPAGSIMDWVHAGFLNIFKTGKITEPDKYGLLFLENSLKQTFGSEYQSCPINGTVSDIILWLNAIPSIHSAKEIPFYYPRHRTSPGNQE